MIVIKKDFVNCEARAHAMNDSAFKLMPTYTLRERVQHYFVMMSDIMLQLNSIFIY